MATFTAVGPALDLDGPLPVAPRYRLLAADGTPEVVVQERSRPLNGVNVWGYPEGTPELWEPCLGGTFREKADESEWQQPRFDGVTAYFPIRCSTISARPEEFATRAERVLDATFSYAVEEALARGVDSSTNPYFGDANLTQLGGGAVAAQAGLNYLENAIGQTGRRGVIHATPGTVSAWNTVNLLTQIDGADFLRTTNGTLVVSGAGYYNTDPSGKTGSDPTVGQEWAFATGPVQVYIEAADELRVSEYVDRELNEIIYRAERSFVALWDTSLQSGVLIDWTP
jgi:hypothetical protein